MALKCVKYCTLIISFQINRLCTSILTDYWKITNLKNLLNSTNSPCYIKKVSKKNYQELNTRRCVNARSWEFLGKLLVRINSSNSSLVWRDASHCKIIDHLLWNFCQDLSSQICSSKLSKSRRKVSVNHGPHIKYIY